MNFVAQLLTGLDMTALYSVTYSIAESVAKFLTPVLFLLAIFIRLMETQIDSLTASGKWGAALRDVLLWGFVLGVYYSLGALILTFFNSIYAWLDTFGSLDVTMQAFDKIIAKNTATQTDPGMWQAVKDLAASPLSLAAGLFYHGSLIILAFMATFLKLANVMAFGVAFIWGLIAIPISISATFKILRGWAYLLALALVWPIIQALLIGMFGMLFANAADTMVTFSDVNPVVRQANIQMLFAVMNLILCAVLVSAPLIANALVTNTPAGAAVVMPFAAAAVAAGVSTIKGNNVGMPGAGGGAGSKTTNNMAGAGTPSARTASVATATKSFAKTNLAPSAPATPTAAPALNAMSAAASPDVATPAPSAGANASTPATSPTAKAKQQQRKGAMITQFRKSNPKA